MAAAPELGDLLGARVRALFTTLAHAGRIGDAAGGQLLVGEAGRTAQGTRVHFSLRLTGGRIAEARYRAYGCPYTLATCEWLAQQLEGAELPQRTPEALSRRIGVPAQWALQLGVPRERLGRLLVIEDALHAALGSAADPTGASVDPAVTDRA